VSKTDGDGHSLMKRVRKGHAWNEWGHLLVGLTSICSSEQFKKSQNTRKEKCIFTKFNNVSLLLQITS